MKEVFRVCLSFILLVCFIILTPVVMVIGGVSGVVILTVNWIDAVIPDMLNDINTNKCYWYNK